MKISKISEKLKKQKKIEFSVHIPGLTDRDIERKLKGVFPKMVLGKNGNLILDLREDPASTKDLLIKSLNCQSNCILWQSGGLTDRQSMAMQKGGKK